MAETITIRRLLSASKRLLGSGRAWLLNAFNIQEVIKSFLSVPEIARDLFIALANTPFPVLQAGNIPDDQLEQNLKQWEKQFGIIPSKSATLQERAAAIQAAWGANGSQGRGYLEQILQTAGVMVYVRENMPSVDYTDEITGGVQYGQRQYGEFLDLPAGNKLQYGGGGKTLLLGNGFLLQDGKNKEVVEAPTDSFEWQQVFIVEGITPGTRISLTEPELNYLIGFILKYKPVHSVAMLRVDVL